MPSSWQAIARVHSVQSMNADWVSSGCRPQTKPTDLGCESACRLLLTIPTIAIYYYLSRKADSHFTVSQRLEGWVDLGDWLHNEMVSPPAVTWSRHRVSTLIETDAWPLSHATTNELYMRTTFSQTNEPITVEDSPLDVASKRRLKLIVVDMSAFTAVNTDDKF